MLEDNSEVQELERRYPTEQPWHVNVLSGVFIVLVVAILCAAAAIVVLHFITKFW